VGAASILTEVVRACVLSVHKHSRMSEVVRVCVPSFHNISV
jgi:hypothetical protein